MRYFYDAATGYLERVRDPLNREVQFGYDAAGRVISQTLPDGSVIGFGYDQSGNVTSITPPERPEHGFGYTRVDLPEAYTPPEVDAGPRATLLHYNEDQQVLRIERPDGQPIVYDYDAVSGRLERVTTPRGEYVYHYDAATGNVTRVEDPDGGRPRVPLRLQRLRGGEVVQGALPGDELLPALVQPGPTEHPSSLSSITPPRPSSGKKRIDQETLP